MLNSVVEKFPKWLKIILVIIGFATIVYRLFLFIDDCIAKKSEKHVMALVTAILCVVIPFVLYIIIGVMDIISIASKNCFSTILC